MMFEFIGRKKRLDSKTKFIGEYLNMLKGREKIDAALELVEQISKAQTTKALERCMDDFIDDMGYVIVGSHNADKIKLHNVQTMELAPDKNGDPVMAIGDLTDDGMMLYQFPLTKGFDVHRCNEFLRSLDLGIDIAFETYCQYMQLIWKCADLLKTKQEATA